MKIPKVIRETSAFDEIMAIIKLLQHSKNRELIGLIEATKQSMPQEWNGAFSAKHIHEYVYRNRGKTEFFKKITEKTTRVHILVGKFKKAGILKVVDKPQSLQSSIKKDILMENRTIYLDFDIKKIGKIERIVDEWCATQA